MERTIEVVPELSISVAEISDLADDAGAVVWDSALVFSHYLIAACQAGTLCLKGKRAIELGSGTGLVGLVAAALGASVVLTDLPHLLHNLEANIKRNPSVAARVSVQPYAWGSPPASLDPPADLVICSDLFYGEGFAPRLLSSIRWLCNADTQVLAAFEVRPGAQEVAKLLPFYGLRATQVPEEELDPDWRSRDILLWRLRRVDSADAALAPVPEEEDPPQALGVRLPGLAPPPGEGGGLG